VPPFRKSPLLTLRGEREPTSCSFDLPTALGPSRPLSPAAPGSLAGGR